MKRTLTPGASAAGTSPFVIAVRVMGISAPANTVSVTARAESRRPGTASASAAPTISSPARLSGAERPQEAQGASSPMLCRSPQVIGRPARSASPTGRTIRARTSGAGSGRTGRRSRRTSSSTAAGII